MLRRVFLGKYFRYNRKHYGDCYEGKHIADKTGLSAGFTVSPKGFGENDIVKSHRKRRETGGNHNGIFVRAAEIEKCGKNYRVNNKS